MLTRILTYLFLIISKLISLALTPHPQIAKAAKTSPAFDPPVRRPFSGHPSVLTMTNDGMRNGRKSNPSQDQLSAIDPVVFKWSDAPDPPLSPSAAPKTDVSVQYHRLQSQQRRPDTQTLSVALILTGNSCPPHQRWCLFHLLWSLALIISDPDNQLLLCVKQSHRFI